MHFGVNKGLQRDWAEWNPWNGLKGAQYSHQVHTLEYKATPAIPDASLDAIHLR